MRALAIATISHLHVLRVLDYRRSDVFIEPVFLTVPESTYIE